MEDIEQIKEEIILAADGWYRDILQQDRKLSFVEEQLFTAIQNYNQLLRPKIKIPEKIPPLPPLPDDLLNAFNLLGKTK